MGNSQAVSGRLSEGRPLSPGAYLSPSRKCALERLRWNKGRESTTHARQSASALGMEHLCKCY